MVKSQVKNRCVRCWDYFEAPYKGNVCSACTTVEPGLPTFKPGLSDYRILHKGKPWETKIKKAEIEEIKRQVAIPLGNGRFTTGRRGEDGKIHEKHIKT